MAEQREHLFGQLSDAVVAMDVEQAQALSRAAVEHGLDAGEAMEQGLADGMHRAGIRYERQEYFIPELLLCSDAMYAGLEVLRPHMSNSHCRRRGTVVIGVVEGDTHDIGKNLVKIMLEAAGFEVHDLGRDVSARRFVDRTMEVGADILALSTLMTTTMPRMQDVLMLLQQEGHRHRVRVLVGGGPVSQAFADRIGADGYAPNASAAARAAIALAARPASPRPADE
ncbi:MAG: corrinoid protein [Syntrophomonadaceae bacterium]|nr:corrinoid protein [Syntrophomonadaceae bacterium]MDH7496973.1 corrinoid protein [Syntrophomonadaceae bacterium]